MDCTIGENALEAKLAEMLCTKMCHDLIGPLGAIKNGAEFIMEDGNLVKNQAMDLISSSAVEAVARIQLFRQAYGYTSSTGEAGLTEIRSLALNFFNEGKVGIDWPENYTEASGISINHQAKKLLLNCFLIAAACLIKGGIVSFRAIKEGESKTFRLAARGIGAKMDKTILEILNGSFKGDGFDPKTVQPFYTHVLCLRIGGNIEVSSREDEIDLVLTIPHM